MTEKAIPEVDKMEKELPERGMEAKELPEIGRAENSVVIGGKLIEIKPTKLKYHRNNVAAFYKIVDMVPLPDIMSMRKGSFGDDRDGDKAMMDWLIAAVDDEEIIVQNYNEMDTGTIEKILSIFKRVNKITEKEEKAKKVESQMREG